jgi:hypothetical protein
LRAAALRSPLVVACHRAAAALLAAAERASRRHSFVPRLGSLLGKTTEHMTLDAGPLRAGTGRPSGGPVGELAVNEHQVVRFPHARGPIRR